MVSYLPEVLIMKYVLFGVALLLLYFVAPWFVIFLGVCGVAVFVVGLLFGQKS